jgi:hypothetical protein
VVCSTMIFDIGNVTQRQEGKLYPNPGIV